MKDNKITAGTSHYNTTGVFFLVYANYYREAAIVLLSGPQKKNLFDPISYQLLCQALELYLKSFIWLKRRISREEFKDNYKHNLAKLWSDSKAMGINQFAKVTPLRDQMIKLLNPYYEKRKFCYPDPKNIIIDFHDLKSQQWLIRTLKRLTLQLSKSLQKPVYRAA